MYYHDIRTDDMLNGDGLRVVLFVSGCNHQCKGCHNPETWSKYSGVEFDEKAKEELLELLKPDYISGLTVSGGDPLHPSNRKTVRSLLMDVKERYPDKTIWLYTGYKFEDYVELDTLILKYIDVLVDGPFVEELADEAYPWAGSTNQRVIDVQETLKSGRIIRHESNPRRSHEPLDVLGFNFI